MLGENKHEKRGCPSIRNLLIGHNAWAYQYLNPLYFQRCQQQLPPNPFYLDHESLKLRQYLEATMNQTMSQHKRFSMELVYDVSDKENLDIEMKCRNLKHKSAILEWGDIIVLKMFQYLDLDAFQSLALTCRYMHAQVFAYILFKSSNALEKFMPWYYKGVYRFTHAIPYTRPITYLELHTYFVHSVSKYIYIYIYKIHKLI